MHFVLLYLFVYFSSLFRLELVDKLKEVMTKQERASHISWHLLARGPVRGSSHPRFPGTSPPSCEAWTGPSLRVDGVWAPAVLSSPTTNKTRPVLRQACVYSSSWDEPWQGRKPLGTGPVQPTVTGSRIGWVMRWKSLSFHGCMSRGEQRQELHVALHQVTSRRRYLLRVLKGRSQGDEWGLRVMPFFTKTPGRCHVGDWGRHGLHFHSRSWQPSHGIARSSLTGVRGGSLFCWWGGCHHKATVRWSQGSSPAVSMADVPLLLSPVKVFFTGEKDWKERWKDRGLCRHGGQNRH